MPKLQTDRIFPKNFQAKPLFDPTKIKTFKVKKIIIFALINIKMLRYWLILFLLLGYKLSDAQSMKTYSVTQDSIIETYKLKGDALRAWDSLEMEWKKKLPDILKKHKITISCAECTSIIANVVLYADSTGKCHIVQKRKLSVCGGTMEAKLEHDYFKFWRQAIFPTVLRNRYILARLSVILKC